MQEFRCAVSTIVSYDQLSSVEWVFALRKLRFKHDPFLTELVTLLLTDVRSKQIDEEDWKFLYDSFLDPKNKGTLLKWMDEVDEKLPERVMLVEHVKVLRNLISTSQTNSNGGPTGGVESQHQ